MEWRTTKPDKPGWYWWRNGYGFVVIVRVYWRDNELEILDIGFNKTVASLEGQWAGPVPEPTDPGEEQTE